MALSSNICSNITPRSTWRLQGKTPLAYYSKNGNPFFSLQSLDSDIFASTSYTGRLARYLSTPSDSLAMVIVFFCLEKFPWEYFRSPSMLCCCTKVILKFSLRVDCRCFFGRHIICNASNNLGRVRTKTEQWGQDPHTYARISCITLLSFIWVANNSSWEFDEKVSDLTSKQSERDTQNVIEAESKAEVDIMPTEMLYLKPRLGKLKLDRYNRRDEGRAWRTIDEHGRAEYGVHDGYDDTMCIDWEYHHHRIWMERFKNSFSMTSRIMSERRICSNLLGVCPGSLMSRLSNTRATATIGNRGLNCSRSASPSQRMWTQGTRESLETRGFCLKHSTFLARGNYCEHDNVTMAPAA